VSSYDSTATAPSAADVEQALGNLNTFLQWVADASPDFEGDIVTDVEYDSYEAGNQRIYVDLGQFGEQETDIEVGEISVYISGYEGSGSMTVDVETLVNDEAPFNLRELRELRDVLDAANASRQPGVLADPIPVTTDSTEREWLDITRRVLDGLTGGSQRYGLRVAGQLLLDLGYVPAVATDPFTEATASYDPLTVERIVSGSTYVRVDQLVNGDRITGSFGIVTDLVDNGDGTTTYTYRNDDGSVTSRGTVTESNDQRWYVEWVPNPLRPDSKQIR